MITPDTKEAAPSPIDIQIAHSLRSAGIISTINNSIEWGESLIDSQNVLSGNMHHPIFQLFISYLDGGFEQPTALPYTSTGKVIQEKIAPGIPESFKEVRMSGSPKDLILHFLSNPETSQLISDKIKEAEQILLMGCVSADSAMVLARTLSQEGFKGELTISDISAAPLTLAKHIYDKLNLENELGIRLTARHVDLRKVNYGNFADNPWAGRSDIVISDVLVHYFSEHDTRFNLQVVLANCQAPLFCDTE